MFGLWPPEWIDDLQWTIDAGKGFFPIDVKLIVKQVSDIRADEYELDADGNTKLNEDGFPIEVPGTGHYQVFFYTLGYKFNFNGHQYGQWLQLDAQREPFKLTVKMCEDAFKVLADSYQDSKDQLENIRIKDNIEPKPIESERGKA